MKLWPREEGAAWMTLLCWACGWAAALQGTWAPLAVGATGLGLLAVAPALRAGGRRWWENRPAEVRLLGSFFFGIVPSVVVLVFFVDSVSERAWILFLALPPLLYGATILAGEERHPLARLLAIAALTELAPVTYAAATRGFGIVALVLWVSLGGYFLLTSLLVMARFRNSAPALWFVRLAGTAAVAASPFCSSRGLAHWIVTFAFVLLSARAWAVRLDGSKIDARRLGHAEIVCGVLGTMLILLGIWMR